MVIMGAHHTRKSTLTASKLNTFQKKSKNSQEMKLSWQIFIEYKHAIQECVDTLALDLLILC